MVNDIYDFLSVSFLVLVCGIVVFYGINTYRHNSDVDYHNKQLQFCKDIYYSDNVILEQCKDYFVIVEKGIKNNAN